MFIAKLNKEVLKELPIANFAGEIVLVDTIDKAEKALAELYTHAIVGIDTETRPSFVRGVYHKVSLVQIATEEKCYLFRLNKIPFPDKLGDFFANADIVKVGLALRDDFVGLNKLYKFKPKNYIDLQDVVKSYGIFELGLQKIFAILFEKKISKAQRLTNWESDTLTGQQQLYAATDAWATLLIYLELKKNKKLTKKQIEKIALEIHSQEEEKRQQRLSENLKAV